MRRKIEKNFYELLNIIPGSTSKDVEEGYREAIRLYGGDSDAVYSLYSKEERESMVELIEIAYETLMDPERKMAYDSMTIKEEHAGETPEVDIDELKGGTDDVLFRTTSAGDIHNTVRLERPFFLENADPIIVEQYRILFSKLEEISHKNHSTVFAFTSAVKGEGKSITCLNLAYLMAKEFKKKTIVVECDLRKESTLACSLEKTNGTGLGDVLKGKKELHSSILRVEATCLYLLPAGNGADSASELLGSSRIKSIISTLKTEFDFVIVDSPPILPFVDMNIISRVVDGVVLVVRAGKTHKDLTKKAIGSLNGINLVGIVLNGADTKLKKYYY